MGKDGSQWKHGYIPENGAATALKLHRAAGGSSKSTTAKRAKKPAVRASEHDLSTREGRARAVAGADLSTPKGRALVAKAQRASLYTTPISHVPGSSVKSVGKPKAAKKATVKTKTPAVKKPTVKARAKK